MNTRIGIIDHFHDFFKNIGDARLKQWWMVTTPIPTILLVALYMLFVLKIGPNYMRNRKAYDLKGIIIVYNAVQTIFSAWMFIQGSEGWIHHYSCLCQPLDVSTDPFSLKMLNLSWWFFISKFTEFADTIFFILRKKTNQVTKLHVIHHSIVPLIVWLCTRYVPIGHYTFAGYLNAFVHTIMYFYYMLTAMGPQVRKYLWWKRYLTTMQIIQFTLVMLHSMQTILFGCNVPKIFAFIMLSQAILFYFMFADFYKTAYDKNKLKSNNDKIKNATLITNGNKSNNITSNNNLKNDKLNYTILSNDLKYIE